MTEPLDDARVTVTIFLPSGYATGNEFAADCGFEIAPVQSCDAESAVPSQIELALEREEKYLHDLIDDEAIGSVMHGDIEGAFLRLNTALSPDPGTVAVASAQYRCTCGAEPYCAPNVHAASCPLAVTSTHHRTPGEVG